LLERIDWRLRQIENAQSNADAPAERSAASRRGRAA